MLQLIRALMNADYATTHFPRREGEPWLESWRRDEGNHVTYTVATGDRQWLISVPRR